MGAIIHDPGDHGPGVTTFPARAATASLTAACPVLGRFTGSTPTASGYVRLPDVPGVGFEEKTALFSVMREVAV